MKKDVSYGIIPLRKRDGMWQVLLINQYSRIGDNTYWVFPKGHPDEGEAPTETARRELTEETGLAVQNITEEPTFELGYTFTFEGELIKKTVVFFLAEVTEEQELVLDPEEVKGAAWCSLSEAYEKIDYKDTKKMFTKVTEYLGEGRMK